MLTWNFHTHVSSAFDQQIPVNSQRSTVPRSLPIINPLNTEVIRPLRCKIFDATGFLGTQSSHRNGTNRKGEQKREWKSDWKSLRQRVVNISRGVEVLKYFRLCVPASSSVISFCWRENPPVKIDKLAWLRGLYFLSDRLNTRQLTIRLELHSLRCGNCSLRIQRRPAFARPEEWGSLTKRELHSEQVVFCENNAKFRDRLELLGNFLVVYSDHWISVHLDI